MRTIKRTYASDAEACGAILETGKRMYSRGFVAANDGNISIRVGENALWATPTNVSKGFMTADMLVKVDLTGNVLEGKLKPSSELKMHLRVFNENPEIQSVVHAHPPVATAFSVAGIPLDKAVLTEGVLSLGEVPLACYATPGTQEVPDSITPYICTHNGVLLANHGALAWGRDLFEAWFRLESIEHYATIMMHAQSIGPNLKLLTRQQVDELLDIRAGNGITTGGRPFCAEDILK